MTLFNPSRLLDVDIGATMGNNAPLGERLGLALEVTILGMATVFSVLIIIWAVLSLLRVFMYDIPNKKKGEAKQSEVKEAAPAPAPAPAPTQAAPAADDKQLVAVITAAIAASEGKPASSLRVVSFRRAGAPRWNER
ncbi:MAG: OadG family protein [Clostridia bacterium]|nr:OadG family protein [Clostridia bacterium]